MLLSWLHEGEVRRLLALGMCDLMVRNVELEFEFMGLCLTVKRFNKLSHDVLVVDLELAGEGKILHSFVEKLFEMNLARLAPEQLFAIAEAQKHVHSE